MAFGESAANYHNSRQPYPRDVFNLIQEQSRNNKTLLDLGCGTGIATVELKSLGFAHVYGCDYDQDMIAQAQAVNHSDIHYLTSLANDMPFNDNHFDVITAFGSFHWFCDDESVNEIKRILIDKGVVFIINKNDASSFREDVLKIAGQFCTLQQAYQKQHYDPAAVLERHQFKSIRTTSFRVIETFTLPELISLVKSMQFWNHVPQEQEGNLTAALKEHFSAELKEGLYERLIDVNVVSGDL